MPNWSMALSLAILILGLQANQALAWGNEGHKIVCAIAYKLLDPDSRKEVDRLTTLYRTPDGSRYWYFTGACTFADRARNKARNGVQGWKYFNRFNRWHFLNVPRDAVQLEQEHCAANCVSTGIGYHERRLSNRNLADWERAEALFFLGHWLGDIHQPLHVSYADDLGGNNIAPIRGGFYDSSHLHGVWDIGIIKKARENLGWWAYARKLRRALPDESSDWLKDGPMYWARESYEITIRQEVQYCEWETNEQGDWCGPIWSKLKLDSSYQLTFKGVVEKRLQMAGVRLAELIRRALNQTP